MKYRASCCRNMPNNLREKCFINYRKFERSLKITKLVGVSCYHTYRFCARIEKISSKLERQIPKTQTFPCVLSHWSHVEMSQLARNLLNFVTQPLHAITWHLDKFHDFRTSFRFYIIYKYFSRWYGNKMLKISCEFLDTASIYTKYNEYHFLNEKISLLHAPVVQIRSM
jgi:hypothetical protein